MADERFVTVTLELPSELIGIAEEVSRRTGTSVSQVISYGIGRKLDRLSWVAAHGTDDDFRQALRFRYREMSVTAVDDRSKVHG